MGNIKPQTQDGNPITEGIIWKEMLLFFFPILFGSFFQQIYNTADAIIVGRFLGKIALSAVGGSSGMIVIMVVGFFVGLASGASVLVSQYYGASDDKNVGKTVHTVLVFSLICGIAIMIVGFLFTPDSSPPVYITYVSIEVLSGALRGVGDTFVPMMISVVGICFLRSIWILLVMPYYNNMYTMMLSYPITWIITSVIFWIYTFRFSGLKMYLKKQKTML